MPADRRSGIASDNVLSGPSRRESRPGADHAVLGSIAGMPDEDRREAAALALVGAHQGRGTCLVGEYGLRPETSGGHAQPPSQRAVMGILRTIRQRAKPIHASTRSSSSGSSVGEMPASTATSPVTSCSRSPYPRRSGSPGAAGRRLRTSDERPRSSQRCARRDRNRVNVSVSVRQSRRQVDELSVQPAFLVERLLPALRRSAARFSAALHPGEASNVKALDRPRNTGSGLASEHRQHGFARLTVDLDTRCRLERLCVRARRSFRNELHVELHRGGVGMNLDNASLAAFLVYVLVERQQLRLALPRSTSRDQPLACSASSFPPFKSLWR